MEHKLSPGLFYGSAIAALVGLLFGLMLHAGWEQHPGGPRILFSAAQAAEPVGTDTGNPGAAVPTTDQAELADVDIRYAPPDPLPVTRLAPQMFDVQPAAADEPERQDAADVADADVPQPLPRDRD